MWINAAGVPQGRCSVQRVVFYTYQLSSSCMSDRQIMMSTTVLYGRYAAPVVPTVSFSPVPTRVHVERSRRKRCSKTKEMLVHVHGEVALHCPALDCIWDWGREGEEAKLLVLCFRHLGLGCSGRPPWVDYLWNKASTRLCYISNGAETCGGIAFRYCEHFYLAP